MYKKTKGMAKGGMMKKTKGMAKGGMMKKTKGMAKGGMMKGKPKSKKLDLAEAYLKRQGLTSKDLAKLSKRYN
jgi:hypothetical protein